MILAVSVLWLAVSPGAAWLGNATSTGCPMWLCPWQRDTQNTCVSAGQSWHSSSFTHSHGLMSQSVSSSVPAFSFSLLISPEKTFQITESCCFQSPGVDRGVILMPSCEIHIKVWGQEEKPLPQPLAGPYHECLNRDLCYYLRNNPVTPKKSDGVIHPVSFVSLGFPLFFFHMRFAFCILSYLEVNQKAFKNLCCLSSAASVCLAFKLSNFP